MRKQVIIRLLSLFVASFTYTRITAQDSLNLNFYEVLKDDSVVMFFDNNYNFTEKSCLAYQRFTRIDQNGDFLQSVIDVDTSNAIVGRGWYMNGLKNGHFEIYYANGQIKSKGDYESGKPVGDWYYFYSNGQPERHLQFASNDTLLIDYYDENATQLVKNGNGHFNGSVAGFDKFYRNEIIASGEIVNGKPDGKWQSKLASYPYCTEIFNNGSFIKGNFPNALMNKNKFYTGRSFLNTLFLPSYFNRLEEFHLSKCVVGNITILKTQQKPNSEYNLENFRSFVNDAIEQVIDEDIRNGKYLDYVPGDNLLKLSFTLNSEGAPKDFKQITSWGDQYYYAITKALTMHAKMPATTSRIYFNLTVIKKQGNTISYNYNFSRE